jgi:hypothetical protein
MVISNLKLRGDARGISIATPKIEQPSSYNGVNFIELQLPPGVNFKSDIGNVNGNARIVSESSKGLTDNRIELEFNSLRTNVINAMKTGFSDERYFPNLGLTNGSIHLAEEAPTISADDGRTKTANYKIGGSEPISPKLANLNPDEVVAMILAGRRLNIYRSMYGVLTYNYVTHNFLGIDKSTSRIPIEESSIQAIIEASPPDPDSITPVSISKPSQGELLFGPSPINVVVTGRADPIIMRENENVGGQGRGSARHLHARHRSRSSQSLDVGSVYMAKAKSVQVRIGNGSTMEAQIDPNTYNWTVTYPVKGQGRREVMDIVAIANYPQIASGEKQKARVRILFSFTTPRSGDVRPADEPVPLHITEPSNNATIGAGNIIVRGTVNFLGDVSITTDDPAQSVRATMGDSQDHYYLWSASVLLNKPGPQRITASAFDVTFGLVKDVITVNVAPGISKTSLVLVEKSRLSSFLGDYGEGKTISTSTLLPGEKTKISMRTFTKSSITRRQASSILDSSSDESVQDFEDTLTGEQTNKSDYNESQKFKVDAHADGGWWFAHVSLDAEYAYETNSAREDFTKAVTNSVKKHTQKASNSRDIEVNTSYEQTEETETENLIEREIENVNLSRTLNFVFRQMNQEFITILHLYDIRIGFFRDTGSGPYTYLEIPLSNLKKFLQVIIQENSQPSVPQNWEKVYNAIINRLQNIVDYNDQIKNDFVENIKPQDGGQDYWRVKRNYVSKYTDPITNQDYSVEGIILSVDKNVLRTEGVAADAYLGPTDALDSYSQGLQAAAVKNKEVSNGLNQVEIDKANLGIDIVKNKDAASASIFEQVFPCCKAPIFSLWPPKEKNTTENREDTRSQE